MNIYVSEIDGEPQVNFTGLGTVEEVRGELQEGEQLIYFYQFDPGHYCWNSECYEAFGVIDALTCLDSTREVLEKLLTAVYRLGR